VRLVTHPAAECESCPNHVSIADRVAVTVPLHHGDRVYGLMGLSMSASRAADREEIDIVRTWRRTWATRCTRPKSRRSEKLPWKRSDTNETSLMRSSSPAPFPSPWWMHPGRGASQCRGITRAEFAP
jgi:hypothetical protein